MHLRQLQQLAPQLPGRAPEWEASEGQVRQVAEQEPAGLEPPAPVVSAVLPDGGAGANRPAPGR